VPLRHLLLADRLVPWLLLQEPSSQPVPSLPHLLLPVLQPPQLLLSYRLQLPELGQQVLKVLKVLMELMALMALKSAMKQNSN
jgi:hypothetical protein